MESLKKKNSKVFATTDARHLMDRPDIDTLSIATSNHWHALLTVWGCQAGKGVYVEKPVAHTIWEGRKMVEAATRYGRVVQAGTQTRSDPGIQEFIEYFRAGHLGKMHSIHALSFPGDGGGMHMANFIAAVRSRRTEDLAAPIKTGRASNSAALLGNISYRLGHTGTLAEARATLAGNAFALEHLGLIAEHLAVHGVNLDQPA